MKILLLLQFLVLSLLNGVCVLAQPKAKYAFMDCFGAIQLKQGENLTLSLKGGAGEVADLFYYEDQGIRNEENVIWFVWEADAFSALRFEQHSFNDFSDVTVFRNTSCDAIASGKSNIEAQFSLDTENNFIAFDNLDEGDVLLFAINQPYKTKKIVFSVFLDQELASEEGGALIVDGRDDLKGRFVLFEIRDKNDSTPITAQLTVDGIKSNSALYNASDLYLPQIRPLSFTLKVDAPMYFPEDKTVKTTGKSNDTVRIFMRKVTLGEQLELQGIEFHAGTTKLIDASQQRLLRLRDFLLFNPNVKLEIQGHVHKIGKDDFLNRRLSRRRAKSIRKYLIENGIDKKRLKAKGYGNTMMRYPEPSSPEEIQANRRVEVKIIEL